MPHRDLMRKLRRLPAKALVGMEQRLLTSELIRHALIAHRSGRPADTANRHAVK